MTWTLRVANGRLKLTFCARALLRKRFLCMIRRWRSIPSFPTSATRRYITSLTARAPTA